MRFFRARRFVLILGGLSTVGIFVHNLPAELDFELAALSLGFFLWCLSPYAVLWFLGRADDSAAVQILYLVGAILVSVEGIHSYHYMLFETVDAQGGLVFVIEPALQLLGISMVGSAAVLLRVWLHRR